MDFIAGISSVFGLTWNFCSAFCAQKNLKKAQELIEAEIRQCPNCLNRNRNRLDLQSPCQAHSGALLSEPTAGSSKPINQSTPVSQDLDTIGRPKSAPTTCNRGRVTKNPFFNFVRTVRPENCGRKQQEVVTEAAAFWNSMPQEEKAEYRRQALPYIKK